MKFADGESLGTDMIVFSAGIRPYDQLARDAGLSVGERGGIEVNEQCITSDADVFAIGERPLQRSYFWFSCTWLQNGRGSGKSTSW